VRSEEGNKEEKGGRKERVMKGKEEEKQEGGK
jgi:hypothetical protein